jgi:long-chain acyl-CoA synthetase
METLSSRLCNTAATLPDHPAIVENGRVFSYNWVLTAVRTAAANLAERRVGRGSRVALVLPNGSGFVSSFFAVSHLGGVVVPLNPSLQETEIAALMRDAQVSAVVTAGNHRERCVSALRCAVGLGEEAVIDLDNAGNSLDFAAQKATPNAWAADSAEPFDPVLYLYSSGSTGRPKRIVRNHFNLLYEVDCLKKRFSLAPSDRLLGVAPFSHTNGLLRSMMASMLSGATLIPLPQFERRAVARTIEDQRITIFIGVPFMFAMLAETRWPQPVDFSSLRFCISASAPLTRDTCLRFHERYGIYVRQLYGTTETGSISANLGPDPEDSIDSLGTPYDGITVEIFSPDRRPLPAGEAGEIGIKSLGATREYVGSPEETAAAFADGYFFPGDIGYKNAAGAIFLVGRKSLFINRGGYKVNPYEIENLIQTHPKVQEVAVVGVDTPYGDQKIKAVVVPTEPFEESDIIEFCRGSVADFKIPSLVEFRNELPKSSTGKLLRKML